MVRQWCSSGAIRLPPERPIPCPNTDETSVCQLHGGCILQPAPQAVGAAGLLEISGFKCVKQLLNRETILATPGNGALSPKNGPIFWARNQHLDSELMFVIFGSCQL